VAARGAAEVGRAYGGCLGAQGRGRT